VRPGYATNEQITRSLEVAQATYSKHLIAAKIASASDSIDGFLHRRFYPEQRTILRDWPNHSYSPTWEINLGDNELISLTQVLSGGTDITADVLLRRGDDKQEPPYSAIQVDLSSASAFTGGTTFQQAITISGLFSGDKDTSQVLSGGVLSGAINSSVTTCVINPVSGYYTVGTGSLLLIGTERLLTTDRRMSAVSGQTITGNVTAEQSSKLIGVTSGAAFAADEIILINAERMRIDDIAGNNLIVSRAWDGTALAAHTSGDAVYAMRTFTVTRGALGSTAASHSDAVSVYVHDYPPLVNELCVAETVVLLQQNAGGYTQAISAVAPSFSGFRANRPAQKEVIGQGLEDIRDRCWRAHGRKGRLAAI